MSFVAHDCSLHTNAAGNAGGLVSQQPVEGGSFQQKHLGRTGSSVAPWASAARSEWPVAATVVAASRRRVATVQFARCDLHDRAKCTLQNARGDRAKCTLTKCQSCKMHARKSCNVQCAFVILSTRVVTLSRTLSRCQRALLCARNVRRFTLRARSTFYNVDTNMSRTRMSSSRASSSRALLIVVFATSTIVNSLLCVSSMRAMIVSISLLLNIFSSFRCRACVVALRVCIMICNRRARFVVACDYFCMLLICRMLRYSK